MDQGLYKKMENGLNNAKWFMVHEHDLIGEKWHGFQNESWWIKDGLWKNGNRDLGCVNDELTLVNWLTQKSTVDQKPT